MAYGVNFAIGPSCFVRCAGCYNHFGNTARKGGLITADEVLDFAEAAKPLGLQETTLSGGDPLTHPEIVNIADGLKNKGFRINFDTVGKAFLRPSQLDFYGSGTVEQIDLAKVCEHIDVLGVPIDGPTELVVASFRRSKLGMIDDSLTIIQRAKELGVKTCINTVAHRQNLHALPAMVEMVANSGADRWQIFEFQPLGPIGDRNADLFLIEPGAFHSVTTDMMLPDGIRVDFKSRARRRGAYFMVDDGGMAWMPNQSGAGRYEVGHITRDRDAVLCQLQAHLIGTTRRLQLSAGSTNKNYGTELALEAGLALS